MASCMPIVAIADLMHNTPYRTLSAICDSSIRSNGHVSLAEILQF